MRDRKKYFHEWHIKNRDKVNARHRQRYLENKPKILKRCHNYYEVNKAKILQKHNNPQFKKYQQDSNKQYWIEHGPEIYKQHKKWVKTHGDQVRALQRLSYQRTRKAMRVKRLLRWRLRDAFIKYSTIGKIKKADEYGVDYQAIIDHLGIMPNDGQQYHIDHIVPLSYFNFDDPEQIKAAFAPKNHQWLEAKTNMSKRDRWIG
jgi:hypothetical protein